MEDEYVRIPKRLILELLRAEDGLSAALINLPPTVRSSVNTYTSAIRRIGAIAGIAVGQSSSMESAEQADTQLPVAASLSSQGIITKMLLMLGETRAMIFHSTDENRQTICSVSIQYNTKYFICHLARAYKNKFQARPGVI